MVMDREELARLLCESIARLGTGWVEPGPVWDASGDATGEANLGYVQVFTIDGRDGSRRGVFIDMLAVADDVLAAMKEA